MVTRAALAVLVALSAGCVGASVERRGGFDRDKVLRDAADIVIVPTQQAFAARAGELAVAVEALCNEGGAARLDAAREAWREAREPWEQADAFRFGPVEDLRITGAVDFWPLRLDDVGEVLAGSDTIDDAFVSGLGATRKGLPVIEYLLFEPADVVPLHDGASTRRCLYAAALARDVARQADALVDAWRVERAAFTASGSDGFEILVNGIIHAAERMESKKLAKPLGRQDGGEAQPSQVESPYAHHALVDLANNLAGVEAVYSARYGAGDGVGIDAALAQASKAIDTAIAGQLAQTRSDIAAIAPPLEQAVTEDPAAVERAFLSSKELLRLFAADMSAALGTTPTFSDQDGD